MNYSEPAVYRCLAPHSAAHFVRQCRVFAVLVFSVLSFFHPAALAQSEIPASSESSAQPVLQFSDTGLSTRYTQLMDELRCPKCQNQNLADSDAPIAIDLRAELHRLLESGNSDEQILEFMTLRYGDFVRYRPQLSVATAGLWLLPVLALCVGLFALKRRVRQRQSDSVSVAMTAGSHEAVDDEELEQRVAKLLEQVDND